MYFKHRCFEEFCLYKLCKHFWDKGSISCPFQSYLSVPCSSVGKESSYNVGDLSLIPGSGRSTREGIGYPFQYFGASLVVQLVNYLPAMWKTWVQTLGWEDSLEKGKATHTNILGWRIPWTIQSMEMQRVGHN